MSVEQKLKQFIFSEILPGEDGIDLQHDDNLIDTGILDSLAMVKLVNHLEQDYGIEVGADEMTPENFASIDAIARLIAARKK